MLVHLVWMELPEPQEVQENPVSPEMMVLREIRVNKVIKVNPGSQERVERKENQACPDLEESPELQQLQENLVNQDPQGMRVNQVNLEHVDPLASPLQTELMVEMVCQEKTELTVQQESRVIQELSRVRLERKESQERTAWTV